MPCNTTSYLPCFLFIYYKVNQHLLHCKSEHQNGKKKRLKREMSLGNPWALINSGYAYFIMSGCLLHVSNCWNHSPPKIPYKRLTHFLPSIAPAMHGTPSSWWPYVLILHTTQEMAALEVHDNFHINKKRTEAFEREKKGSCWWRCWNTI